MLNKQTTSSFISKFDCLETTFFKFPVELSAEQTNESKAGEKSVERTQSVVHEKLNVTLLAKQDTLLGNYLYNFWNNPNPNGSNR